MSDAQLTPDEIWEGERDRLTALAYRVLGSWHDAEDVVAQSWPRFAAARNLDKPQAWLTTVVTRLAIDAGRRARARRETYVGPWLPEPVATDRLPADVAETKSLLGLGVLRLMDQLDPEERAIFVLREAFELPYNEISQCVGRSSAACRQVVSRTRVTLRNAHEHDTTDTAWSENSAVATAMVEALATGNISRVVELISDGCVLWADGGGVVRAALHPVRGCDRVRSFLTSVAPLVEVVEQVHVNGGPALIFTNSNGSYLYLIEHDSSQITGIQVHANPTKLAAVRQQGDAGN